MMFNKVAVAVSGGIDSAVAAKFLKDKGFEVIGIFMRNWDEMADDEISCSLNEDLLDAKWICDKLRIPLVETNFVKEYWNFVFQETLKEYASGLTPNPDILCNSFIKFGRLFKFCRDNLGADAIATGHYARTSFHPFLEQYCEGVNAKLLTAKDVIKDQTFFLSRVSQEALRRTMFPVSNFTKEEIKSVASGSSFRRILEKKESMGICFVGEKKFKHFISQYIRDKPGLILNLDDGKVMGEHKGVHYWTVGQKCLSHRREIYFVARKDAVKNIILVVRGRDHPALYTHSMIVSNSHWIDPECESVNEIYENGILYCKYRMFHRKPFKDCILVPLSRTKFYLQLQEPAYVAVPGQFAVFYQGEECLGSAKIDFAGPSTSSLEYFKRSDF